VSLQLRESPYVARATLSGQQSLVVINKGLADRAIMRNGQNKRMRGRSRKSSHNPLTRVYESNGPDVKIRGTANHIAEKYLQLARDAQTSGDPISAENYHQHAEHYLRMIAAAQEQMSPGQANFYRPPGDQRDDGYDDGDEDSGATQPFAASGSGETPFGTREPQPVLPRDAQPFPARDIPANGARAQAADGAEATGEVDQLPSFITGGGQQPSSPNGDGHQADRFPLHRRRRRHRTPRGEAGAPQATASSEGVE
jgi:hypothetical protein